MKVERFSVNATIKVLSPELDLEDYPEYVLELEQFLNEKLGKVNFKNFTAGLRFHFHDVTSGEDYEPDLADLDFDDSEGVMK